MANLPTRGCLVIPHLPIRLALQQHPALAGLPVAISTPGQRGTVIDCSPEARALGLRVGMQAREAQNLCPQVTILPDDPLRYAAEHRAVMLTLLRVCPTLQSGLPGCVYLDLRGLGRHYAHPEALGVALLGCVDAKLEPRLGMASSMFTAYVAARRSRPETVRIVDVDTQRRLLERCPVELLPLSAETLRRMERLGLQRLEDIGRLPLTALVAQFGKDGRRAWQLAQGEDPDPFIADPVPEPIIELLRLPAASNLAGDLAVACRIAASRLLARPELRGRAIRRLRLDLRLEHGGVVGRSMLVKGGTRDLSRLAALLRSQIDHLTLDGAVAEIQLEALALGEEPPHQPMLGGETHRPAARLRGAISELAQRYGASPLYQVVEVNRWARLPEHRWALTVYEA
jgi:nucleotidyltransferase/DNA polymerase involved in DNA repair